MLTTLTTKLKLTTTPVQFTALRATQLAYRDALNRVSSYAFAHGKTSNCRRLQRDLYAQVRSQYTLPAQMKGEHMEASWSAALWRQFGAAIDMLDNALAACPAPLWTERLWSTPPSSEFPPQFAEFWYVSFHALVWLDLYLSGVPEEEFAPPSPFAQGELDSEGTMPEQPYTREELRAYLASTRQKCHDTLLALTDEQALRPVEYPWSGGQPVSFLELLLYNMRHVQEHAAQLSLFLGQHSIPAEDLDWVPLASGDPGSR